MTAAIFIGIVVLALLGEALFVVFGAAAMALFGILPSTSITGATNDVFSEKFADSPLLVTIPLFTFAGYLMAESGTPKRLVTVSRAWFGWMPGGLAIVCLVASAFFTTFTGGSGITIVAIGGLLYPALIADDYEEKFSLGLVTAGGSLGLLFPPSLPIVIYGVVAGIMIEKLFLAGIIPGFITLFAISAYAAYQGVRTKRPRTPFVLTEAISALRLAKWELLLPVVLLSGMFTGALRIHEAAAFTALYVLVVEVWIYKDVDFRKDLPRIIRESMTLVGAILAILALAIGFTAYLIQAGVPMKILDAMDEFITSPTMFLLVLNVFLLIVGMLMDIFSAIVVVVPLIIPIANEFGIDPYHLGIVFLLNLEIGYLTPPVGLNLFIASFRFDKSIGTLYKAVMPYIGLLVLSLVVTTYIPSLTTSMAALYGANDGSDLRDGPVPEPDLDPGAPVETDDEGLDLADLAAEGTDEGELDLDDLMGEIAPEPEAEEPSDTEGADLVNAAPAGAEPAPAD